MTLAEDARKMFTEGARLEPSDDSTTQIRNLQVAVQELQTMVVRLAAEVDRLSG